MCPHLPITFDDFPIKYKVQLIHIPIFGTPFLSILEKTQFGDFGPLKQWYQNLQIAFFLKWKKTEFQKLVGVLVVPYI